MPLKRVISLDYETVVLNTYRVSGKPAPSDLLLPELFHHHQRVKIRALNPEGARHHAVRLEAELPVNLLPRGFSTVTYNST